MRFAIGRILLIVAPSLILLLGCSRAISPSPMSTHAIGLQTQTAVPTVTQTETSVPTTEFTTTPTTPPQILTLTPTPSPTSTPTRGDSFSPSISADGRFIAFVSAASDLVQGDINDRRDVFVYDRLKDKVELVSVSSDGTQSNDHSGHPSISADGRYVAFWSAASNLVPSDSGQAFDILIHDRQTGITEGVSAAGDWPMISADGRYVVFESNASNLMPGHTTDQEQNIYVYDRQKNEMELVSVTMDGSPADGDSEVPTISTDGRYVVFWSWASNLVQNDIEMCQGSERTFNCGDIFVYDRQTRSMERIPVGRGRGVGGGGDELSISADGRYVAFYSFVYDRQTEGLETLCETSNSYQRCAYSPSISADGRWVAFTTPFTSDQVFVYDRVTGKTEQVSVASDGTPANAESGAVIFHEGFFGSLSLSADGRWVAFASLASNLAAGDTQECDDLFRFSGLRNCYDVFVHDRETGLTEWVSKPHPDEGQ